jgi:hypothetical protein
MPTATWLKLKDLKLNANHPTRRKKHHRKKNLTHHEESFLNELTEPEPITEPNPPPAIDNDLITATAVDSQFDCFLNNGLHFIHLNVRSLLPKISEIRIIASKTKAAIICLSETWIDDSVTDSEISIAGYSVIRLDRNREGGGVCSYIRNDFAFTERVDLSSRHDLKFESLWLELLLPKTKPILVGVCYLPDATNLFLDVFADRLANIAPNTEVIIMGDFNIYWLKKTYPYKKYNEILSQTGLKQIITKPTRITDVSSSLIDHILCSHQDKISQFGNIPFGMSDHMLIFCTRKIQKLVFNKHKTLSIRSLRDYTQTDLINRLSEVDWSEVMSSLCADDAWAHFTRLFTSILDIVAPSKEIRIKHSTDQWMTSEILDNIRSRDILFRKFQKNPVKHDLYDQFCKLRNKIQRDIKKAKSLYFQKQIEENRNNSKKLWQNLKNLGYSSKGKDSSKVVIDIQGTKCFDAKTNACHFNKFFTGIAASLVNKLPTSSNLFGTDTAQFQDFISLRGLALTSLN